MKFSTIKVKIKISFTLGEHFIYLNSVTYWPEDGLKISRNM